MRVMETQEAFYEAVEETAETLAIELSSTKNGSIVRTFQMDELQLFQPIVHYGILEKALRTYEPYKEDFVGSLDASYGVKVDKLLLVHALPEIVSHGSMYTPTRGLMTQVVLSRAKDVQSGKLQTGEIAYDDKSGQLIYDGESPKGAAVIILCDYDEAENDYLKSCIEMMQELDAGNVLALPLIYWNNKYFVGFEEDFNPPDWLDEDIEEDESDREQHFEAIRKLGEKKNENNPIS